MPFLDEQRWYEIHDKSLRANIKCVMTFLSAHVTHGRESFYG